MPEALLSPGGLVGRGGVAPFSHSGHLCIFPVRASHTQGRGPAAHGAAPVLDDRPCPLRPTPGTLPFLRAPHLDLGPDLPASPSLPQEPNSHTGPRALRLRLGGQPIYRPYRGAGQGGDRTSRSPPSITQLQRAVPRHGACPIMPGLIAQLAGDTPSWGPGTCPSLTWSYPIALRTNLNPPLHSLTAPRH